MAAKQISEITSDHFWPSKFGFRLVTGHKTFLHLFCLWTIQALLTSSLPAELKSDPRVLSKTGGNSSQAKDRKSEDLWSERAEVKSIAMQQETWKGSWGLYCKSESEDNSNKLHRGSTK